VVRIIFSWTIDFVIDNFSCFRERPVFIIYRNSEPGLAREIETMEVVSL
jgi:hypothetical protein